MEEIRDKLETAANFANDHAQRAQASYATRYNLRARDKIFHVGDQVIVLATEGGNKLRNRWQGPATVVKVKPPHSYLVDMGTAAYVRYMPIRYANLWHVFKVVASLLKKMPSLVVF